MILLFQKMKYNINKMKLQFLIFFFLFYSGFFSPRVFARATGAEFLTFGVGARASGMGESFSALSDDISAIYYNPAGLVFLKKREVMIMHSNLYNEIANDMFHDFVSFAIPLAKKGTLGISTIFLHSGRHPITEYNPSTGQVEVIGDFHTWDAAGILSYAQALTENMSIGTNLKYIYSKYGDIRADAYAIDVGILYRLPLKNLRVGMNLENLGTDLVYKDKPQADALPLNLRGGVAYSRPITKYSKFTLSGDLNKPFYHDVIGYNIGIEWAVINLFSGRIGYFDKGNMWRGYAAGFGLKYKDYQVDFANVPNGEIGRNNRISITLLF